MDKFEDIVWPEMPFDIKKHAILIGNRGSQAHGTWIPNTDPNSIDDKDIMAIVVPPKKYYFGLETWEMTEGINDPWDVVVYEFKKFIGLLVKQNPNVLMMLWLEPEDYYHRTFLGDYLIAQRDKFSSRESLNTFVGYARGQLGRMTHVAGRGYLGAKRKQLVEKYGYDTKNAAHLIRLLHMGIEFLETGKLNVKRTWDVDLLKAIKTGKHTLVEVNQMAGDAFAQIEEVAKKSPLPKRLDLNWIDNTCIDTLDEALNESI